MPSPQELFNLAVNLSWLQSTTSSNTAIMSRLRIDILLFIFVISIWHNGLCAGVKISRRSFLIGASSLLSPVILPQSGVTPKLGPPEFVTFSIEEYADLFMEMLELSFKRINLSSASPQASAISRNDMITSRVTGVLMDRKISSVDQGLVAFADHPSLAPTRGWHTHRVLNSAGIVSDSLVKTVSPKRFDALALQLSNKKIGDLELLVLDARCDNLFETRSLPRIILESD